MRGMLTKPSHLDLELHFKLIAGEMGRRARRLRRALLRLQPWAQARQARGPRTCVQTPLMPKKVLHGLYLGVFRLPNTEDCVYLENSV